MNTIIWSRSILNHAVSLVWLGILGLLSACCQSATSQSASSASAPSAIDSPQQPVAGRGLASGLYWKPAGSQSRRWAILLPGASGLKVFDDEEHYFRAAGALNERGFNVLLIDYKRAYKAASPRPDLPTGGKIAWVIEQAVEWAHSTGAIEPSDPGIIVAWSLGAEGLWSILNDPETTSRLGIRAAAAYYPANDDARPIISTVPLLILTGEADDVTPAADIKEQVRRGNSTLVELLTFDGAHHGFDITSIHPPRTVRLLPFVGPKGTFGYDERAATRAWERLIAFLDSNVPVGP